MIKAIIIVHLWSLVVAGGAWALQRDGNGRVGAHFPAPNIWLTLIILSFLPCALYFIPFGAAISFPKIEGFENFPIQISESAAVGVRFPDFLTVYLGLGILLISRTLWQWSRLQRLTLSPTAEPEIYTMTAELPPLTLSWPRRAVAIPRGFEIHAALIRHECTHLRHNDAELTLLLLLLQDMMLRAPGVGYLVRQWRLSIELRADHAATNNLAPSERKDYAALLLNFQRPIGGGGGPLPCPAAHLRSIRHRNVKIRLVGIIEDVSSAQKHRWTAAILSTFFAASAVGLLSAGATANEAGADARSGQIDYVQVDYVKRTSVQIPASCPGLIEDIKRRDVRAEEKKLMVNGQLVLQQTMNLGTVILRHDVRRDGRIYNPAIISSTHPCFESNARAAITQWIADTQGSGTKNVAVKMHFVISGATLEELNVQLKNYLQ